MTCPWCGFQAAPPVLHAHLSERHGDAVTTSERNGRVVYQIICPRCGDRYSHGVRKGSRDPGFLTEFEREIQMVALDMLIHHLMAEHQQQTGG
jgi:hypothetical protein